MDEIMKFVDIHSHVVFGADDGVGSLTEAVEMLKLDRAEGAAAVFATHHYGRETAYTPCADLVGRNFELLKERAAVEVPEVSLYLGTEWYCAWELAERIYHHDAFRMNGTDYVLVEFKEYGGTHEPADKIVSHILKLQSDGFKPILAHPERYESLQEDWSRLKELTDHGILLQVNAYDLDVNLSLKTKDLAQWLAKERMISFIGSDMHSWRLPRMKEGVRWLYENTDEAYADAVAFGNAEALLGV